MAHDPVAHDPVARALDALDEADMLARIVARLGEDPSPGTRLAQEYAYEALGEPDPDGTFDPRRPEHAAGFAAFLRDRAHEEMHGALNRLSWEVRVRPDGRVEAWREMVVPRDWPGSGIRERPLGVFWAYAEEAAEAHWGAGEGPGSLRVVVHAAVEPDGVDWAESVVANAAEGSTVGEERELRLTDSARVEVLGLAVREGYGRRSAPIDASHLAGELLPAGEEAAVQAPGPRP